jgi:methionyl-tRNA synthetase
VHVIGKGIIRFHAVYWPAILLSAGIALPHTIFVHEYLTVGGLKISKSAGDAVDPTDLVEAYGSDALRWWLLSEVGGGGDTDFTVARLVDRANEDLANNLGNFINRGVALVHRYRAGTVSRTADADPGAAALRQARADVGGTIDAALDEFDFRRAVEAVVGLGRAANRYVENARPWELARAVRAGGAPAENLDRVLAELIATGRDIAYHLTPFLPAAADRISVQCGHDGSALPAPAPVFPRLAPA